MAQIQIDDTLLVSGVAESLGLTVDQWHYKTPFLVTELKTLDELDSALLAFDSVGFLLNEKRKNMVLSAKDFRNSCDALGYQDMIEALMLTTEIPRRIKNNYFHAQEFKRLDPDLIALAAILGLTDDQVDEVFS